MREAITIGGRHLVVDIGPGNHGSFIISVHGDHNRRIITLATIVMRDGRVEGVNTTDQYLKDLLRREALSLDMRH